MMQITHDRAQAGTTPFWRLCVDGARQYAKLERFPAASRRLFTAKPRFAPKSWQVEVYAFGEHDEPAFAASFFNPVDAKAAVRAALS